MNYSLTHFEIQLKYKLSKIVSLLTNYNIEFKEIIDQVHLYLTDSCARIFCIQGKNFSSKLNFID